MSLNFDSIPYDPNFNTTGVFFNRVESYFSPKTIILGKNILQNKVNNNRVYNIFNNIKNIKDVITFNKINGIIEYNKKSTYYNLCNTSGISLPISFKDIGISLNDLSLKKVFNSFNELFVFKNKNNVIPDNNSSYGYKNIIINEKFSNNIENYPVFIKISKNTNIINYFNNSIHSYNFYKSDNLYHSNRYTYSSLSTINYFRNKMYFENVINSKYNKLNRNIYINND